MQSTEITSINGLNPSLKSKNLKKFDLYVEGVKCSKCLFKIEALNGKIPGLQKLSLNMGNHIAEVQTTSDFDQKKLFNELKKLGFGAQILTNKTEKQNQVLKENRILLTRLGVAGAVTGNIMLLSIAIYSGVEEPLLSLFHWMCFILFIPLFAYSSQPFFKNSWLGLKNKRPSIDLPIAVALLIGSILSVYHIIAKSGAVYFDSLSSLVFLLLGSRYFLARIQQKFLDSSQWRNFIHDERVLKLNSKDKKSFVEIPISEAKIDDLILVKEGQKFPVDGLLMDEYVYIDSSLLTGESKPLLYTRGEMCFAGTICLSKSCCIELKAKEQESRIGQMIKKMNNEFLSRTPLVALTDKAAQYFTGIVLLIGLLFVTYMIQQGFINEAIQRALALIVLACPCAMAFATPLSQSLSLQCAMKNGFLIKSAESLEKILKINEICFDKTGTLTKGNFQLQKWSPITPSNEVLSAIYALESQSSHPIAKALTLNLKEYENSAGNLSNVKQISHKGIEGEYNSKKIKVIQSQIENELKVNESIISNKIDIFWEGHYLTSATFGDEIRTDAFATVKNLKKLGFDISIITGDKKETALQIGNQLEISPTFIYCEMSPEEKSRVIKNKSQTMMVGDGANDSIAMASAELGIAVKGSMELSLQSADIYMDKPGISPLVDLILLSRKSMFVIKRNLVISLFYNIICGTLALLGYINPLVAAILMPINSTIVLLSSLFGTKNYRPFKILSLGSDSKILNNNPSNLNTLKSFGV